MKIFIAKDKSCTFESFGSNLKKIRELPNVSAVYLIGEATYCWKEIAEKNPGLKQVEAPKELISLIADKKG